MDEATRVVDAVGPNNLMAKRPAVDATQWHLGMCHSSIGFDASVDVNGRAQSRVGRYHRSGEAMSLTTAFRVALALQRRFRSPLKDSRLKK